MNITLLELEPGQLWVAEEPAQMLGLPTGARATIVKLEDGGLLVHSPVSPTTELRRALDAIGPIRCILAPIHVHNAYPADWATLYPEAKMFVSPRWSKPLPREPQVLGDEPDALWSGVLEQVVLQGNVIADEVEFFHPSSKTLIVCDLLYNLPPDMAPAQKALAGVVGLPTHPAPSRLLRALTKDNKAMRASLERVLAWDFERIILSHGPIVESGGREVVRDAYGWLLQGS